MNCFCSSNPRTDVRKFTILLVHVVASTPPSALCYTFAFAIHLVQDLKEIYESWSRQCARVTDFVIWK